MSLLFQFSRLLSFLFIVIVFSYCEKKQNDFFYKKDQIVKNRDVKFEIFPSDSITLETLQILNPGIIKGNSKFIFIADWRAKKIVIVNKDDFSVHTIAGKEGKGPGELLHLTDFDVQGETIFIADERASKIVEFNINTGFVDEKVTEGFNPHRITVGAKEKMVVFSPTSKNLLNILNEDNSFSGILKTKLVEHIPLEYEGYIILSNSFIFYAGYSESILKKFDMKGNDIFTISTIDNFPSEANYVKFGNSNQRIMRYSPGALYATISMNIVDDKLILVPHHNQMEGYNVLDIYDTNKGSYLYSIRMRYYPTAIHADDQKIYTIGYIEGEPYLIIYDQKI